MSSDKKRKLNMNDNTGIDLTTRVVIIAVGDEPAKFQVHEDLLRSRSPFFDAALSKSWKEGREGQVNLPEDCPAIVLLYLQYLYSGKFHIQWTTTADGLPKDELLPEYITLAHLYVLGEKLGDIDFKNAIVNAILKRITVEIESKNYNPIGEAVDIIYKGTTAGSPARKLLVDNFARRGMERWVGPELEHNNPEFLLDLSRALLRNREGSQTLSVDAMKDGRYIEAEKADASEK